MEDAPDPGQVPHVEGPVEAQVGPKAGDVFGPKRGVEIDARHVRAARAIHQHERDQGHAQDDDQGGEEPPGYVFGEHLLLPINPGGSLSTSIHLICRR